MPFKKGDPRARLAGLHTAEIRWGEHEKKRRKTKLPQLTRAEIHAKTILENAGCHVVKGSYPDFIVSNPQTRGFVLVEIKAGGDELSGNQKATFAMLQHLNIPVRVVHVESTTDFSELQKELNLTPF
jgi:hypothetical protein